MILSVLPLNVLSGRIDELVEVFQRHKVFETSLTVQGCRQAYLVAPPDGGAYVLAEWDDAAAYQRWLDHPERGAATADLLPLLEPSSDFPQPGQIWQVLHHVSES